MGYVEYSLLSRITSPHRFSSHRRRNKLLNSGATHDSFDVSIDLNDKRHKDEKNKGFYCPLVNGKTKCLGKGKGRDYPPMEPKSRKFLQNYYRLYNEHLLKLLKRLGYSIPNWLKEDLNDV